MKVFARLALGRGHLHAGERALLLEGHWPDEQVAVDRWSLDCEIDSRCAWIDDQAAELAEHFAAAEHSATVEYSLAWLNVVKLRYLLVKLLRVVAFFDSPSFWKRVAAGQVSGAEPNIGRQPFACHLFFEPGRDACYLHVMRALGLRHGFEVVAHAAGNTTTAISSSPHGSWRRAAETCLRPLQPRVASSKPRVVLCGNPRLLAPVCRELVRRRMQPWWLVERFAPRNWLRWRRFGVGSLVCDGAEVSALASEPPAIQLRPIELPTDQQPAAQLVAPAVEAWLAELHGQLGPIQARQSAQIGRHLDQLRPLHVVLDQDGSPFNRAVVAAARQCGVPTSIVQHGAPFIRFGFAPLVADRFCAWGNTSRAQLLRWGVAGERIHVTGTAMTLPPMRIGRSALGSKPPRFVLLATLAPADNRPDAVHYHLTSDTFAAMFRGTLAALSGWRGASVLIKLHPRDPHSSAIRSIAAEFDRLKIKIGVGRSLASVLRRADCVLSCASSAGIEAAARGWPVIQLMPEASGELLESQAWGLVGTARTRSELTGLIEKVLAGHRAPSEAAAASIIAATGRAAASRMVDAILAPAARHDPANHSRGHLNNQMGDVPAESACI